MWRKVPYFDNSIRSNRKLCLCQSKQWFLFSSPRLDVSLLRLTGRRTLQAQKPAEVTNICSLESDTGVMNFGFLAFQSFDDFPVWPAWPNSLNTRSPLESLYFFSPNRGAPESFLGGAYHKLFSSFLPGVCFLYLGLQFHNLYHPQHISEHEMSAEAARGKTLRGK